MRKVLFFTWFSAHGVTGSASCRNVAMGFCFLIVLIVMGSYIGRTHFFGAFPRALKTFLRIDITLFAVGALGEMLNQLAEATNHGWMPVVAANSDEVTNGAVHTLAWSGTNLIYLCDILVVDFSKVLMFLFPGATYASIGDCAIAAAIIFSWWSVLVMIVWVAWYVCAKLNFL